MEGALQILLKALTAPDRYVMDKVVTRPEYMNRGTHTDLLMANKLRELPSGEVEYPFRKRYDPIERTTAKRLLQMASPFSGDGDWVARERATLLDQLRLVHPDPSVRKALEKLLVSGKQGDVARAKLVELAAKQGLLPNLLMHGTNEHAITGIAKTKKTIPQKSWEDDSGLARPEPRTYWTPKSDVARGMAAETSKVGNIREELRHQALSSRPAIHQKLDALVDKFIGPDHKALSQGVLLSQEYLPSLPYNHPIHVGRGIGHILSEAKKQGLKDTLMEERFREWQSLMKQEGIDINTPPETWKIPPTSPKPKVGDAGRPAVITTKLSKIAKRLSPEDLKELVRRMANGVPAKDIVEQTYEITSRAIPASALRATVTKPPNPALGETMRGSMLRGKSKMLPLLELAKLLMKGMR